MQDPAYITLRAWAAVTPSFAPTCYKLPQLWHIATIWKIVRWEGSNMATTSIRLDQELIDKATIMARALNRTPPKQIEHWAKIAAAEREAGKLESYDFG